VNKRTKKRSIISTVVIAVAIVLGIIAAPTAGAATVTAAGASAATAAASCTVKAALPARIAITKHYTETPVRLVGCAAAEYGSTNITGPEGLLDVMIWNFGVGDVDYLAFYDWEKTGTYRTSSGMAWIWGGDDIPWVNSSTVIKYGSSVSLTVKRTPGISTLSIGVKGWNPDYNIWGGWKPWTGKAVSIYSAPSAKGPWKRVAGGRTNSLGKATAKLRTGAQRYWQVRTTDGGTTFGANSAVRKG